jgi:hypothetical protein
MRLSCRKVMALVLPEEPREVPTASPVRAYLSAFLTVSLPNYKYSRA